MDRKLHGRGGVATCCETRGKKGQNRQGKENCALAYQSCLVCKAASEGCCAVRLFPVGQAKFCNARLLDGGPVCPIFSVFALPLCLPWAWGEGALVWGGRSNKLVPLDPVINLVPVY